MDTLPNDIKVFTVSSELFELAKRVANIILDCARDIPETEEKNLYVRSLDSPPMEKIQWELSNAIGKILTDNGYNINDTYRCVTARSYTIYKHDEAINFLDWHFDVSDNTDDEGNDTEQVPVVTALLYVRKDPDISGGNLKFIDMPYSVIKTATFAAPSTIHTIPIKSGTLIIMPGNYLHKLTDMLTTNTPSHRTVVVCRYGYTDFNGLNGYNY